MLAVTDELESRIDKKRGRKSPRDDADDVGQDFCRYINHINVTLIAIHAESAKMLNSYVYLYIYIYVM